VREEQHFDGVNAALRVHASVHAPLLCVADVFEISLDDRSRPASIER